jgi:hypothetical protein
MSSFTRLLMVVFEKGKTRPGAMLTRGRAVLSMAAFEGLNRGGLRVERYIFSKTTLAFAQNATFVVVGG